MIDFKHLQGNTIISVTAIGVSYLLKKAGVRQIFLPTNNIYQVSTSFAFLMVVTILGKKTMDQMAKFNWVTFTGKEKNPNEGFIGPLKNETFGPQKWDFLPE